MEFLLFSYEILSVTNFLFSSSILNVIQQVKLKKDKTHANLCTYNPTFEIERSNSDKPSTQKKYFYTTLKM